MKKCGVLLSPLSHVDSISDGAILIVKYTNLISAEGYYSPNECPGYGTKQSDGEAPVILELWEMQSTPSFPSLPGPL